MAEIDEIKKLSKQLTSDGRAFKMSLGTFSERLDSTLLLSEARAYTDALSILDEILADNDNFLIPDATRWEVRLGLITNGLLSLDDRKAAILRKYNHPGDIPARQSWDYVQGALQAAGFDVYVHQNSAGLTIQQVLALNPAFANWGSKNFGQINFGNVLSFYSALFTSNLQFGQANFGSVNWAQGGLYKQKVVNHLEPAKDVYFSVLNWRTAFYIGDLNLGEFANVPAIRREELRQTILRLKPAHSAAYLLVNYT